MMTWPYCKLSFTTMWPHAPGLTPDHGDQSRRRYGFATLGLHRLQLETLADNEPMMRAAIRSGFLVEGTLRRSAWTTGVF
jgi:hypothetical protein